VLAELEHAPDIEAASCFLRLVSCPPRPTRMSEQGGQGLWYIIS
jgi:hypothetical protein